LVEALDEEFSYTRSNACWALGYLRATEAVDRLEELVAVDPDEEVQNAAAFAVSEIKGGNK